MKCRNIFIYKFINSGQNDDEELDANARSIRSRYLERLDHAGTAVTTKVVDGRTGLITIEAAQTPQPNLGQLPGVFKRETGVYLLTHVNGTILEPPASVLADTVFTDFIQAGAAIDKINIAGCVGGGKPGKKNLRQDELNQSSIAAFCTQLQARSRAAQRALPPGLAVCAYTIYITTYDARESYFMTRQGNTDAHAALQDEARPARSAHISGSGGRTAYKPTHPRIDEGDVNALAAVIHQIVARAWGEQKVKADFLKQLTRQQQAWADWEQVHVLDFDTLQREHAEHAKEFRNFYVAKVGSKIATEGTQEQREVWKGMSDYARYKIVMIFDGTASAFRVGSLTEYTDNDDIDRYIKYMVEAGGGPPKLILSL